VQAIQHRHALFLPQGQVILRAEPPGRSLDVEQLPDPLQGRTGDGRGERLGIDELTPPMRLILSSA
jgi:hypothetical protein